jgi:MFS family permease
MSFQMPAGPLLMSCSGNEIGPFRAIEESTLAHLTPAANRGDIYAWYSLIGTAGTAGGMVTSGWVIQYMRSSLKWDVIRTYRTVFWGYAVFGVIKFILSIALSKQIEAEKKPAPTQDPETAPLLGDGAEETETKKSYFRSLLPDISAESRIIVVNLCILFALDAFSSGLAPL